MNMQYATKTVVNWGKTDWLLEMATEDDLIKTQLRIPSDLYEQVKNMADRHFRSTNAEIVYLVSLGIGLAKEHASPEDIREIIREELARLGKVG